MTDNKHTLEVHPTHVEASTPEGVGAWLDANHPTGKHTPGPWECSVQSDKSIVIWTARGQAIAKVPKSSGLYVQTEVEANAALIASAPTLLTELDAANQAIDALRVNHDMAMQLAKDRKAERDKLKAWVEQIATGVEHEPIDEVYKNYVIQARALLAGMEGE